MAGVRLTHETLRGVTYVVGTRRRYTVPVLCPKCGTTHTHKTYHLDLDGEGAVIVSPTIFERLREVGLPGLRLENEVLRPPNQSVSIEIGGTPMQMKVAPANGHRPNRLTVLKNKLLQPRLSGLAKPPEG